MTRFSVLVDHFAIYGMELRIIISVAVMTDLEYRLAHFQTLSSVLAPMLVVAERH